MAPTEIAASDKYREELPRRPPRTTNHAPLGHIELHSVASLVIVVVVADDTPGSGSARTLRFARCPRRFGARLGFHAGPDDVAIGIVVVVAVRFVAVVDAGRR